MKARAREEEVAGLEALGARQEVGGGGEVTEADCVGGVAAADGGGDGEEDDEAAGDDGNEVEVKCEFEVSPGPLVVSIPCPHQAANRDLHSFVWHHSH